MDKELQAAYNEWLLKYGFRVVDIPTLKKDRPMLWAKLPSYVYDIYIKRIPFLGSQLKTLAEVEERDKEELQHEYPTKAPGSANQAP